MFFEREEENIIGWRGLIKVYAFKTNHTLTTYFWYDYGIKGCK